MSKKKIIPDIDKKKKLYDSGMSLSEIAKKFDTYAKKIERELKSSGHVLRGRSEAQKVRLDTGKAEHPTKGKNLSDETKIKISDGVAGKWKNLSEKERAARAKDAKKRWDKKPDKDAFIQQGLEAIKKTSVEGSKFEKHISDLLVSEGFQVYTHEKHQIANKNMHLDIFLPTEGIAIEVDGPAHYKELYGDDTLSRTQKTDDMKNSLLLDKDISVIRVAQPSNVSQHFMRTYGDKVVRLVKDIVSNNKKTELHYIYDGIKNG